MSESVHEHLDGKPNETRKSLITWFLVKITLSFRSYSRVLEQDFVQKRERLNDMFVEHHFWEGAQVGKNSMCGRLLAHLLPELKELSSFTQSKHAQL